MTSLTTLARPYTKAAFTVAVRQGSMDQWARMLATLAMVVDNTEIQQMLANPSLGSAYQTQFLIDICQHNHNKEELSESVRNFLELLAENKRLTLLAEISRLFQILKADQEKIVEVSIVSAFALNNEQETILAQTLSKKLAREVIIKCKVDESLLGGIIIRANDLVIDGSVRGKLVKLAKMLNS